MDGKTRHEIELARDDGGATASILQQLDDAVAAMKNTPGIRFSAWHRIDFQHNASSAAARAAYRTGSPTASGPIATAVMSAVVDSGPSDTSRDEPSSA